MSSSISATISALKVSSKVVTWPRHLSRVMFKAPCITSRSSSFPLSSSSLRWLISSNLSSPSAMARSTLASLASASAKASLDPILTLLPCFAPCSSLSPPPWTVEIILIQWSRKSDLSAAKSLMQDDVFRRRSATIKKQSPMGQLFFYAKSHVHMLRHMIPITQGSLPRSFKAIRVGRPAVDHVDRRSSKIN
ncbi:uncharacterized protein G2W53_026935 [Senna tora]|uniref:Uncharacterized protein n=1 Tax=Senna tora TaxID=362788 RepID=A0A834WFK0_9FABA|nr:uncharacterized protein G2W53_026935 [Senna tora]